MKKAERGRSSKCWLRKLFCESSFTTLQAVRIRSWSLKKRNGFRILSTCPDNSSQTPGCKDTVYAGKLNGERQYKQKRYLQWTLQEILEIVNGSSEVQQTIDESFPARFENKIVAFRMLYNFVNKHKNYKFQRDNPHESRTCEICENIHLFIMSINRNLKQVH